MMRSQSRTFPIFDRLGGRQVIAKAMTKSGFSENADRLLRSFLDREKISASGMMFLMSMADDKGIRIESQDFEFSSGHNVQRDANEAAA